MFIALYLDEDVSVLVAELLRSRGFVATTTREEARLGSSDAAQLAYATSIGRTLLTHNRTDFEALARTYAVTHRQHYGIILAVRRPPYELVRRLLQILNHVTADEMIEQVRYI